MNRIVDSFIFFNELDLLEIRLNSLNPHVDVFVLVEATQTFQGKPKPLYFAENRDRFAPFLHKIEHVVVKDLPETASPWDREHFQRDAILRGLDGCGPDDLIVISDADEIPRPEAIPRGLAYGEIAVLRQRLFYYKLNMGCVEMSHMPWSAVIRKGDLVSPAQLRERIVSVHSSLLAGGDVHDQFRIVENGGWHFSYLGTPEETVAKIEAFSHDEYNSAEFKDVGAIRTAIGSGRDLFGRSLTFRRVPDSELPPYVLENRERLSKKGMFSDDAGAEAPGPADSMLFDQFSRYQACADLLTLAGIEEGDSLLDIGSGPECLFKQFIAGPRMYFVDPLIAAGTEPSCLANDVFSPVLDDRQFDYVTSVDVFEHIAPEQREAFIERLSSLGKRALIIGFPCRDASDASRTDDHIERVYRQAYGRDYSWLEEHHRYGLPSLEDALAQLRRAGWNCQAVGHGHAPWLQELLSFIIGIWEVPQLRDLAVEVSRIFNHELYRHDFKPPFYRQFIVATKEPLGALQTGVSSVDDGEPQFRSLMELANRRFFSKSLTVLDSNQAGLSATKEKQLGLLAERDAAVVERDAAIASRDQALQARDAAQASLQHVLSTRSWKITRPLRIAVRAAKYGLTKEDLHTLDRSLKARAESLPAPVRQQLRTVYRGLKAVYAACTRSRRSSFMDPKAVRPAARDASVPDYIFWGVIDWHFRYQRPQHLAEAIASTGRRVFYVSSNLENDPKPGFSVEQIDQAGRLFQIRLNVRGAPAIYQQAPDEAVTAQLRASLGEVLDWADCGRVVSLVQHSFWHGVASVIPGSRLVYDCMDHHEGFGNNDAGILALEQQLLGEADLTIATSAWLADLVSPRTTHCSIVRNAGDYAHFSRMPSTVFRDPAGRKVIGYIGAIAEWFDLDLVEKIARRFENCLVLLVGNDSAGAAARLRDLPNVQFTGELPYAELPFYVHGFDVCLLPFRIIPLTLATNPVKVYEYLGAGKPVVATALPEMQQFGSLVESAKTHDEFLAAIGRVLTTDRAESREDRQAFARAQTWRDRADSLVKLTESRGDEPLVSVIVVTYNNLALTKACLASLDSYSDYEALEVIVVDNASSDGTQDFLQAWAADGAGRKLVLNDDNRGFAAANNQGLAIASGEYLILLNNDTHVTPGWVRTMVTHMKRDQLIGLLGPVTNNIGNEAKIEITYDDMPQMLKRSAAYTRRHLGKTFGLTTAAFFCVAMPRAVYEKVGPLDEAFGRGFFEDDDYCRRVEQLGLRIVCAEDVFIHHHLSASFNKLKSKERQELFERNKALYESKWGQWTPHAYKRTSALASEARKTA